MTPCLPVRLRFRELLLVHFRLLYTPTHSNTSARSLHSARRRPQAQSRRSVGAQLHARSMHAKAQVCDCCHALCRDTVGLVRLWACILGEVFVGILLVGGFGFCLRLVTLRVHDVFDQTEAPGMSNVVSATRREQLQAWTGRDTAIDRVQIRAEPAGTFMGIADDLLLAPLQTAAIDTVKVNKGGSSISLRLQFDNGARAAFKPQQTNLQSIPSREIVAYRLNRLLGLRSVAPAIPRSFPVADIFDHLLPTSTTNKKRLAKELIHREGQVVGAVSWWIPVVDRAKVSGLRLDSMEGIVTWKRYLSQNEEIPEEEAGLVAQVSDMVLFDYFINNSDRWSGGNARVSEDGRLLYFMDNTLAFGISPTGHSKTRTYLERCQKFSRSLVERLRRIDEDTVRTLVTEDIEPFDVLLQDQEIQALMSRREHAIDYIDALVAEFGADSVLVFP